MAGEKGPQGQRYGVQGGGGGGSGSEDHIAPTASSSLAAVNVGREATSPSPSSSRSSPSASASTPATTDHGAVSTSSLITSGLSSGSPKTAMATQGQRTSPSAHSSSSSSSSVGVENRRSSLTNMEQQQSTPSHAHAVADPQSASPSVARKRPASPSAAAPSSKLARHGSPSSAEHRRNASSPSASAPATGQQQVSPQSAHSRSSPARDMSGRRASPSDDKTGNRRRASPSSASPTRSRSPSPSSTSPTLSRKGKGRASNESSEALVGSIGGAAKAPTSLIEQRIEQRQTSPGPASVGDLPNVAPSDVLGEVAPDVSSQAGPGQVAAGNQYMTDLESASGAETFVEIMIDRDDPQTMLRVPQPLLLTSTVARGAFHQCGTARRVKVYELSDDTWQDRGTGFCAGVYDEGHDEALLVARMEEECIKLENAVAGPRRDPTTAAASESGDTSGGESDRGTFFLIVSPNLDSEDIMLRSRVVKDDVYQLQQDTLVVWTEPDGTDMALSFQEAEGCHEVWEFVVEVQKHFHLNGSMATEQLSDPPTPDPGSPPSGDLSNSQLGPAGMSMASDPSSFALPDPTHGNLEQIDDMLRGAAERGPAAREKIAEWLVRGQFIRKLCPVFQDAEDLEDLDSLHSLCSIMQTIVILNDSMIIEVILSDDVFDSVLGMFEYDPQFPTHKASYRDYFLNTARFKQVVDIDDAKVLTKIHQVYRLQFLRDVILARILDDAIFSVLNSYIFFNQVDIVGFCAQNEHFLPRIYSIFRPGNGESSERKHDAVFFLQHLCAMGKQIQLPNRIALYRTLAETGVLDVIEYAVYEPVKKVKNAAAEMLMIIVEYDPNSVRNHVLDQAEQKKRTLVAIMSDLLHSEEDLGLKTQICESLRILFDNSVETPPPNASLAAAAAAARTRGDPERFLAWFYEGDVDHLFSPLRTLPKVHTVQHNTRIDLGPPQRSALISHLCSLLCHAVAQHTFRSQYFVITSSVTTHVGSLLFAREKHICLAAVRFFRACIASNNQFTNRHFIKLDIFGALLSLIERESTRDNLVLSACLDLFEHIHKENMRPLVDHMFKSFRTRLTKLAQNRFAGKCFAAIVKMAEQQQADMDVARVGAAGDVSAAASSSQTIIGGSESQSPPPPPGAFEEAQRRKRDMLARGLGGFMMDSEEEDYFNDEDDDEEDDQASDQKEGSSIGGVASSAETQPSSLGASSLVRSIVPYLDDDSGSSSSGSSAGEGGDREEDLSARNAVTMSRENLPPGDIAPSSSASASASAAPASGAEVAVDPQLSFASNGTSGEKRKRSMNGDDDSGDGDDNGAQEGKEERLDRLAKRVAAGPPSPIDEAGNPIISSGGFINDDGDEGGIGGGAVASSAVAGRSQDAAAPAGPRKMSIGLTPSSSQRLGETAEGEPRQAQEGGNGQ